MALREVFSVEAMGAAASWLRPAVVSGTTLAGCSLVLLADAVLYSLVALTVIDYALRLQARPSAAPGQGGGCSRLALTLAYAAARTLLMCIRRVLGVDAAYVSLPQECGSRDGTDGGLARDPSLYQLHGSPMSSAPEAGEAVLAVRSLGKRYVRAGVAVPVIAGFSAELRAGTITCLLGSNGAGDPIDPSTTASV